MELKKYPQKDLMDRAVSKENLLTRAIGNKIYAKNDFNNWVNTLIKGLPFESVLDVCCGTGNQLVLYAALPNMKRIVGIDISEESLAVAKDRINKTGTEAKVLLKSKKMEDMFLDQELGQSRFELISCFYGLYYSDNIMNTITEMISHLSAKGTILIVGPFGKNNSNLFKLLENYFCLPEIVKRSSTTFMEAEVRPALETKCRVVEEHDFLNLICYPNAESFMEYWKASTFYEPKYEVKVKRDIEGHFSKYREFVIEKHVKAYLGRVYD